MYQIIIATIILGALYVNNRISMAKNLTYQILDVDFSSRIMQSHAIVTVDIFNPDNVGVTVNEINLKVFYNSKFIGVATVNFPFEIIANGHTQTKVELKILNYNILTLAIKAIADKKGTFKFNGTIKVNGFTLPINYDYNL